jgi:transposase-like protein
MPSKEEILDAKAQAVEVCRSTLKKVEAEIANGTMAQDQVNRAEEVYLALVVANHE